jgi:hypothetical protein
MTELPTLTVVELRAATGRLLDDIQRTFGEKFSLAADLYWNVDLTDSFDLTSDAGPQIDVGSLADDVDSMRAVVGRSADEPAQLWHDLAHLAGLLRGIAAIDHDRV